MALTLIGRSSSHFTRMARIFAHELGVELEMRVLTDIGSMEEADYGGNPGMKVPALLLEDGPLFGSLPICRELARRSTRPLKIVWPEDLTEPLLANAQEITTEAMATQVLVIKSRLSRLEPKIPLRAKAEASLRQSVGWLDARLPRILERLPPRDRSFLEVGLFCLGTHLDFRETMPLADAPRLQAFCASFGERASAAQTPYAFDRSQDR